MQHFIKIDIASRFRLTTLIVALGLALAACGSVGSGNMTTERRSIGSFDSLDISEGINVEVVVDPAVSPAVAVTIDDNLMDKLVTEVRGSTLVIEFDGSVSFVGGDQQVSVMMPSLESVEISGGADLDGTGSVDGYRLSASGGADVDLSGLDAMNVEVDVSGGADVRVFASESVEGEASGGASVTVLGDPDRSRVDTSGGANVEFDN